MEKEMVYKIYALLQNSNLAWHAGWLWEQKDEWFKQFTPKEIDNTASEMAKLGMIETNGFGFRRKEKTLKEKIIVRLLR